MDRQFNTKRPLGERIRELGQDVSALNKAICEDLDWREKSHPIDLDDWDDGEAV